MAAPDALLVAHNRFGYGLAPGERPAADPRGWLLGQLESFRPDALAPAQDARGTPEERFAALTGDKATRRAFYDAHREAIRRRFETARTSPTPFAERLVHFWANHFAISADKKPVIALTSDFEFAAIRPHVAGRFADLLLAAVRHPAMLLYLDQARSIGPQSSAGQRRAARAAKMSGLNENLAREILELHSMGVRSGYTQEDVIALAKALTGYAIAGAGAEDAAPGTFRFDPRRHEPGARRFLGKTYPEGGEEQARAMIEDIARHPATARHVATKLARHFIADEPPAASVAALAAAFTGSDGDLKAVYRALIADPAAWRVERAKFKSPWEWAVSAARTADITVERANWLARVLRHLGHNTWTPQSPAGFPDLAKDWLAPAALLRRADSALGLGALAEQGTDARAVSAHAQQGRLSEATVQGIAAAGDPAQGLALFFMSPEFLWR